MSASLNITGLASDIDWQKLASDISSAQKTAATTALQNKKTVQQEKLSAWQAFNTTLSAITNYIDTNKLYSSTGYQSYAASLTSSDSSVTASDILSVSIGKGTLSAGTYSIEVTQLARAEKISSDAIGSSGSSLNLSGDFSINGKTITVTESDTLTTIAKKINSTGAGVTASVLTVSDSEHYLTLESTSGGSAGMSLAVSGTSNIVQSLGLSVPSLAHASGSDALSDTFENSETALGTLLGMASPQSGSVVITGTDDVSKTVDIDLSTDSLQAVADKINAAGITGVTASVEEVDGRYQLRLANVDSGDLTDDNNALHALGVLQEIAKNVIQTGAEAKVKIDGYEIASSSNTITGAIPGLTLKLTETNESKPVTLEISQDNSGLSDTVNGLVSGVNEALGYIKDQNTYNSEAASSKPLFGDISLSTIKNAISTTLLAPIDGNTTYRTAASVGICYGSNGTLSFDTDKFSAALSDNPEEVIRVIRGLSTELYDRLNVYVDTATGTIKSIRDSIDDNIDRINKQLTRIEARCDAQAELLNKRFTALQILISEANQTRDWLTAQVEAMNSSRR